MLRIIREGGVIPIRPTATAPVHTAVPVAAPVAAFHNAVLSNRRVLRTFPTAQLTPSVSATIIPSGTRIDKGEYVKSPDGRYFLQMQDDGNFVLYDGEAPLWATGTRGNYIQLETNGNVVLHIDPGNSPWGMDTADAANVGDMLAVQSDGNLVLYRKDGGVIWDRHNGKPGGGLLGTILSVATIVFPVGPQLIPDVIVNGPMDPIKAGLADAKAAGQVVTGNFSGAAATIGGAIAGTINAGTVPMPTTKIDPPVVIPPKQTVAPMPDASLQPTTEDNGILVAIIGVITLLALL